MSRVHFVGGEKGGVGKSVLARLLCQWCVDREVPWSALDADPAQGKLLSAFGVHGRPVDLAIFRSVDQIIDRALGASNEVVVDLPAHSRAPLARWLRESDVFGLAEESSVQLVFWFVTDGGFDSLSHIERLVHELPASAGVVVVKNQRWVQGLASFEGSALAGELLGRGGRSFDLPALDSELMYKVEARKTSWRELLTESPGAPRALGPLERRRLALWLDKATVRLEPLLASASREVVSASPSGEGETTGEVASSELVNAEREPLPSEEAPGASSRAWPAAGVVGSTGARTWTEVGEGYQIHHVRYP